MKFVSTIALGVALAMGGVAMVAPAGAQKPKKEKPAKPPSYDISKPVRAAIGAAQKAMETKDIATASAKVAEAQAASVTPDDKYITNSILYDIGRETKDQKIQAQAIDGMLASGQVPADRAPQFHLILGSLSYAAKDYKKAEIELDQAIKLGTPEMDAYAMLVEVRSKNGNPAGALATLEEAIAKQKASGQKVPNDWYGRGISIGYTAKLAPQVERLTQSWITEYPTPDNWRDSLITFRDLNKIDVEYELDLMRLLRTAKAMKGEADYYQYAEQVYLKFPGEGKSVIDEGVAAGMLKLTPESNIKMFSDTSNKRVAADKADLASAEKSARAAANGVSARATADSYLGYGDWAKAIDLYRVALQKGGVDANVVNTRLGMALAKSGDKAGAKTVFASITGPRASLAKYWMIWLDQQA